MKTTVEIQDISFQLNKDALFKKLDDAFVDGDFDEMTKEYEAFHKAWNKQRGLLEALLPLQLEIEDDCNEDETDIDEGYIEDELYREIDKLEVFDRSMFYVGIVTWKVVKKVKIEIEDIEISRNSSAMSGDFSHGGGRWSELEREYEDEVEAIENFIPFEVYVEATVDSDGEIEHIDEDRIEEEVRAFAKARDIYTDYLEFGKIDWSECEE